MATMRAATPALSTRRCVASAKSCISLPQRRSANVVVKAGKQTDAAFEVGKTLSLLAVSSQWALSGQAQAAVELSQIADSDGRLGAIAFLFLPALGWVAFNILQPAFNQLNRMGEMRESSAAPKKATKRRAIAGAVGLGAALSTMMAQSADASAELSQIADSDARLAAIATLFVPAIGWVAFNMLQPVFNQLDRMQEMRSTGAAPKKATKKRGIASAVGLGAGLSLMMAETANASTELSQIADSDARLGAIALLFVPALGWVAFNILQPLFNQINRMDEMRGSPAPKKATKKRGIAGAVGVMGAMSLLAAQSTSASTELSQLAESDGRLAAIATLFVPVVGWVAFNILQPAFNQLNRMSEMNEAPAPKKGTQKRR